MLDDKPDYEIDPNALEIDEAVQQFKPKVIYDGSDHDHKFVAQGQDKEGMVIVMCPVCWHGTAYNPQTQALEEGKIVDKPL